MISTDTNLKAEVFGNGDRYFPMLKRWATMGSNAICIITTKQFNDKQRKGEK